MRRRRRGGRHRHRNRAARSARRPARGQRARRSRPPCGPDASTGSRHSRYGSRRAVQSRFRCGLAAKPQCVDRGGSRARRGAPPIDPPQQPALRSSGGDDGRAPPEPVASPARAVRPDGKSSRCSRSRPRYKQRPLMAAARSAMALPGNRPFAHQPFGASTRPPSGRVSRSPQPALFAQYSQARQVSTEYGL